MTLEERIAALAEQAVALLNDGGINYDNSAEIRDAAHMLLRAYRAEHLLREATEVGRAGFERDQVTRDAMLLHATNLRAQAAALVEEG